MQFALKKKEAAADGLIAHLEDLARRRPGSRAAIQSHIGQLRAAVELGRVRRKRVKDALLFATLACSFLLYYFTDVALQIVSMPSVAVFLPTRATGLPDRG